MPEPRIAIYPGTFDPITNGHLDIIRRSLRVVDKLVIGVAINAGKTPLFGVDDRVALVRSDIATLKVPEERLEIQSFSNLLMHFAHDMNATLIMRGLRAVSDFEYEFQMAGMNTRLDSTVETVFLMSSENHQFIASRLVKEIASLGGDIRSFVSPLVAQRLEERFSRKSG